MTLDQAIAARRSIRRYAPQPLAKEQVQQVLEAGRLAPSARNAQTWRFTVNLNPALQAAMPEACHGQQFVGEAPAILAVWATEDRTMACGQSAASVDCSIALAYMQLKAAELGLGTCWLGSFDAEKVKQLLGLPAEAVVVAVTPLGHPAEQPPARPRKPLKDIADIRE